MIGRKITTLKQGRPSNKDANLHLFGEPEPQVSIADAAEMLNVGTGTVKNAKEVLGHGIPELDAMVARHV